jgi:4-amino-4-deoxy-L-arabinose transferase-like glycosyltransferase
MVKTETGPARETVVDRHYRLLTVAVLGLALFNLAFRLNREFVAEWDESLYAISGWETLSRGSWIGTTFLGQLDYYNTKPPLLVWLIAIAFKIFGANLLSLRLVSVVSAWATVLVLQLWTKRQFGAVVALLASLVLSTTFGFIYVHSGRSASTDALFTLIVVLTVVTLWKERTTPSARAWLGALLAAAFLLRGMAVLMPLTLIAVLGWPRHRLHAYRRPGLWAICWFVVPVGAWTVARFRVDGLAFFRGLFLYDFVERMARPIEGHAQGTLYYLRVLERNHYDWLLAVLAAALLFPSVWQRLRRVLASGKIADRLLFLAGWAGITVAIPMAMQTRIAWYLNTFYPAFAVMVALVLAHAVRATHDETGRTWRTVALYTCLLVCVGIAEAKLVWYSLHYRDATLSVQSILLEEAPKLKGQKVYLVPYSRADHFVTESVVHAVPQPTADYDDFLRRSQDGDFVAGRITCDTQETEKVRSNGRHSLCRRRDRGAKLAQ